MEEKYIRINYTNENFRNNIDYLTSKYNITKNSLENKLGMGEGSLSRYCKPDEKAPEPKIGIVNSLAKSFNVTIDDLINNDLQKKDQDALKNNERKEILFCKKLIQETNSNLLDWKCLESYNYGFIKTQVDDWGTVVYSNWVEENGKFKSKFVNKSYEIDEVEALTVMLNSSVQVVIIKFIEAKDLSDISNISEIIDLLDIPELMIRYELYLVKENGKVLPSCSSHIFLNKCLNYENKRDDAMYEVLENLYNKAYDYFHFGKDKYEMELIYDDYLNDEIPF